MSKNKYKNETLSENKYKTAILSENKNKKAISNGNKNKTSIHYAKGKSKYQHCFSEADDTISQRTSGALPFHCKGRKTAFHSRNTLHPIWKSKKPGEKKPREHHLAAGHYKKLYQTLTQEKSKFLFLLWTKTQKILFPFCCCAESRHRFSSAPKEARHFHFYCQEVILTPFCCSIAELIRKAFISLWDQEIRKFSNRFHLIALHTPFIKSSLFGRIIA